MPSAALKHLADKAHVDMDRAHHLWDKAKGIVSKEYGSRKKVKGYWALVMGITKKMMGLKESMTFKEFLLTEKIEAAVSDPAEDTIGWWIVREKDDTGLWGPFSTHSKAADELQHNHPQYNTRGVDDKTVYIEHGWVDEGAGYKFHQMEKD